MVERLPCKQRVACSSHAGCSKNPSARKREKLSIGRSGTNRAHKFADGKTMADDKTQLGFNLGYQKAHSPLYRKRYDVSLVLQIPPIWAVQLDNSILSAACKRLQNFIPP